MTMSTRDKIYLFATDNVEAAIEAWFNIMKTPTPEELACKAEREAARLRWEAKKLTRAISEDGKVDPDWQTYALSNRCYADGEDERHYFNIEIKREHAREYQRRYERATLYTAFNHKMTEHITRTVDLFVKQCPQYGIVHVNHFSDGDDAYHVCGITEAPWDRHQSRNGVEWMFKHVHFTEEEMLAAQIRQAESASANLEKLKESVTENAGRATNDNK